MSTIYGRTACDTCLKELLLVPKAPIELHTRLCAFCGKPANFWCKGESRTFKKVLKNAICNMQEVFG